MPQESEDQILKELNKINERLIKIEKYLWPPINPKDKPTGPTDNPPIPGGNLGNWIQESLQRISNLESNVATKQNIEELHDTIIRLTADVDALKESLNSAAPFLMSAGAAGLMSG